MKIIFFGTSEFAIPALNALIKHGMMPLAIITAPDKPKGRGKQLTATPIKTWCQKNLPDILIFQPEKLKTESWKLEIPSADIYVIVSYGKIVPKEIFTIPHYGALNIHPSLLPKYRGSSPIQTAILNGDAETGVTIMLIDEKMDSGPIVAQQKYEITNSGNITYQKLHNELAKLGATLLIGTIPKWIEGKITPVQQNNEKATYTKLLLKEDGKIDWKKSAEKIERMIRAYNPWPGAYTKISKNKQPAQNILKIKQAEMIPKFESHQSGIFFNTSDGFPAISCGEDALKLLVVQPAGKKEMSGKAYLLGHKDLLSINNMLESQN